MHAATQGLESEVWTGQTFLYRACYSLLVRRLQENVKKEERWFHARGGGEEKRRKIVMFYEQKRNAVAWTEGSRRQNVNGEF